MTAFWKISETIPEAQRIDGASLKHDISLPITSLPEFVATAGNWLRDHVPDGQLVAYGHVGDGNLHFNLNQAPGSHRETFLAREASIKRTIHDRVRDFGGSFSAEHGIGRLKVGELERYASPAELDLMRAVKKAFDPNGILNPGKVLRSGYSQSRGCAAVLSAAASFCDPFAYLVEQCARNDRKNLLAGGRPRDGDH